MLCSNYAEAGQEFSVAAFTMGKILVPLQSIAKLPLTFMEPEFHPCFRILGVALKVNVGQIMEDQDQALLA